jgi:hypothetical protein
MTKQQLLEHLQDIERENFEVKAAKTDVPKMFGKRYLHFLAFQAVGLSQKKKTFKVGGIDDPKN